MGSGSAFFLYNLEDKDTDENLFDNWNAMTLIPTFA